MKEKKERLREPLGVDYRWRW